MRVSHSHTAQPRRTRGGFTLLEILIVLAIIGVIAAMAVPNLFTSRDEANKKNAALVISNVGKAADLYNVGNNTFPNTIDQLLVAPQAGVSPLLDKVPVDAWGTAIMYEYPNTKAAIDKPAIWSAGPNRQNDNGQGDDINNWKDTVAGGG